MSTQSEVKDYFMEGITDPAVIAKKMRTTVTIVKRALTNLRKSGDLAGAVLNDLPNPPAAATKETGRRVVVGPQGRSKSMQEIARELAKDEDYKDQINRLGTDTSLESVDPFIKMGVTMQFMKFAGGRLAAHQIIEEVYNALALFTK